MRHLFKTLLALAAFATASEKVYTPYFELVNVHSDYQFATAKLLKSYVDGEGAYQIELPARSDSLVHQPAADSVRKLAQAQNCPKYLLGDLTRLGEAVFVSFSLYNTADGTLVWNDRLKASGPDDLDPILQKIARSMGTKNAAAKDGNIYSVTQQDSKKLRQKQANASFGATIGGTWLPSKPVSGFLGGFGVNWLYDNRNMLVQIEALYQGYEDNDKAESVKYMDLGISAYYPFLDQDWTPFVGGGIAYSVVDFTPGVVGSNGEFYEGEVKDGAGLLFRLGGGLLFSRTSTVNLRLRTEYMISTFKIEGDLVHGLWMGIDAGFGR